MKEWFQQLSFSLKLLITGALFGIVLAGFIPDPIPFIDELFFAFLLYQAARLTFSNTNPILEQEQQITRRLKEIRKLLKKVRSEIKAFGEGKILGQEELLLLEIFGESRRLEQSIREAKPVVLSAKNELATVDQEIHRLESSISRARLAGEQSELAEALRHARTNRRTLEEIFERRRVRAASLEKFYHLLRDTDASLLSASLKSQDDRSQEIGKLLGEVHSTVTRVGQELKNLEQISDHGSKND